MNSVKQISKSVGAIGLYTPLEARAPAILGTGFVVGNGEYAITNHHVVDKPLNPEIVQHYVFMSGVGQQVNIVKAEVIRIDPVHDLALLKLAEHLPPVSLGSNELLPPGTDIAFTGFPIGAVLGLFPATHKGIISAITPDAIPARGADQLSTEMLKRLGASQLIYQLDATAYPGNSGSPVFLPESGAVVGVINKVIVKDTKESALSSPSGISYAVPVEHVLKLIPED
ncbi:S1 family peptidase [Alteromonas gilva]|uniref:Serine protease n=1 Tax=Alteromonas gilva TaxID=2987522 RepID=A0ABT5L1R1_9ALTE|nr:serine protease [Alteromonas gilva]MDC8830349.1 serine protease [Alteromonas gilva]